MYDIKTLCWPSSYIFLPGRGAALRMDFNHSLEKSLYRFFWEVKILVDFCHIGENSNIWFFSLAGDLGQEMRRIMTVSASIPSHAA